MPSPEIEQGKPARRRINISVSATSVLTLLVLVIAAMTCAYIWGVIKGRSAGPPRHETAVAEQAQGKTPEDADPILQAHELEFTQALRGEKPPRKEPIPEPGQTPEPAQNPAQPAEAAPIVMPPADPGAMFDYVFQVAALRDEQACDNLRQKLEGYGLRTRMERSGKVFIVLIALRGNAERVAEIAAIAADLRLGTPLLRSRKPVAP